MFPVVFYVTRETQAKLSFFLSFCLSVSFSLVPVMAATVGGTRGSESKENSLQSHKVACWVRFWIQQNIREYANVYSCKHMVMWNRSKQHRISCKSCKDIIRKQKYVSSRVVPMARSAVFLSVGKVEKRFISNLKWHCLVWDCLNSSLHGPRAFLFRWAVFVCGSSPQINSPLSLFSLMQSTAASGLSVLANFCCALSWGKATHRTNCPQMASRNGMLVRYCCTTLICLCALLQWQARFWDNYKWQTCHSWFVGRWLTSLFHFSLPQNRAWPAILGLIAKNLVWASPFQTYCVINRFLWGPPCILGPKIN